MSGHKKVAWSTVGTAAGVAVLAHLTHSTFFDLMDYGLWAGSGAVLLRSYQAKKASNALR